MGIWAKLKNFLAPEIDDDGDDGYGDEELDEREEQQRQRPLASRKAMGAGVRVAPAMAVPPRRSVAMENTAAATAVAPMPVQPVLPVIRPQAPRRPAPELAVRVDVPATFDDAQRIAGDLIAGHAALVNFEQIGVGEQNRVCDFVNGVSYVLKGEIRRISDSMVLYVPRGVDVTLMQSLDDDRR